MSDERRVNELLEEALDSGRTPEEVCIDDPELLVEVREQWERCRIVAAQIDELFPSPTALGVGRDGPSGIGENFVPVIPGYQLQTVLGRGGMGLVYKAVHVALNRTVALKMLLSGPYAGREELTRFKREARAIAGLSHP